MDAPTPPEASGRRPARLAEAEMAMAARVERVEREMERGVSRSVLARSVVQLGDNLLVAACWRFKQAGAGPAEEACLATHVAVAGMLEAARVARAGAGAGGRRISSSLGSLAAFCRDCPEWEHREPPAQVLHSVTITGLLQRLRMMQETPLDPEEAALSQIAHATVAFEAGWRIAEVADDRDVMLAGLAGLVALQARISGGTRALPPGTSAELATRLDELAAMARLGASIPGLFTSEA